MHVWDMSMLNGLYLNSAFLVFLPLKAHLTLHVILHPFTAIHTLTTGAAARRARQ